MSLIFCNGVNHSDEAKEQNCKRCGRKVARRADGKVFDTRDYYTEAGNPRHVYSCWFPQHRCDEKDIELYQDAKARSIAAGELIVGQKVIVARGRKIPKGITGEITWLGASDFGMRARVQPDEGEAFFIALKNLDVNP
ncbi:hypothetical protein FF47_35 [Mycobacterium phage FF47]|uniref:Uncharacterized protein n=2 Tax=Mapvirus Ff47 TaxID=1920751 RepID=A0A899INB2_9CAUD|nr:hypothetical protein FF47_35 [Mycobacterium phage FF47]QSL99570.1 hypothetical protein [Mycobacterium phage Maco2]QXN76642.1 hypothetical protein [Mycobacterium phage Maco7]UNY41887.1 hypothetical protein [Mycobacterium phage Maco6]WKV22151.1 hypothetical protein 8UZL_00033 [Mycobacteroides phage 8UZL]AGI12304.1 hypothetical protein FF47_35 [Mycobacterium phage FF47]